MSIGLINNFKLGDGVLVDKYDIYSLALECKTAPDIVRSWRTDDIMWLKIVMTVQANMIKNKGK